MKRISLIGGGVAMMLAACSLQGDYILPGERLDIRDGMLTASQPDLNAAQPIRLPSATNADSWTHRGGNAQHNFAHLAFSAQPVLAFAAPIGQGDTRQQRITAAPVAAGGVVYTLDSAATVVATGTDGGRLWARSLIPAVEKSVISGGGLAIGGGYLYVTTGYGEMFALNLSTGAEAWRQDLDASASATPTYADGIVYVVGRNSRAWALDAETGRIDWSFAGAPSVANYAAGASVAVSGELALFPLPSEQLIATFRRGGLQRWTSVVAGDRIGQASAFIDDIATDPVISGQTVYVGNYAGRIAALDLDTGDRKWTATEGTRGQIWVAGGSLFAVNDLNQLIRLDTATGRVIWRTDLPNMIERRAGKTRAANAHYGPIIAGGQVILGSSDGLLRMFDPVSGQMTNAVELPAGAASEPIVVGGTLFIVNKDGQLLAFR